MLHFDSTSILYLSTQQGQPNCEHNPKGMRTKTQENSAYFFFVVKTDLI